MNWIALKRRLAADPHARQLLAVECTGGSNAKVRLYEKTPDGHWQLLHRGPAFIGRNGLGKTQEGDAKTPVGTFRPVAAFGIKPNPGCPLPYIDVVKGTVACDVEGPFYNRIVGPSDYAIVPSGEQMWTMSPKYDYGLQIDYNPECIYPLGSAIFVHCKSTNPFTGGCVAVDRRLMKKILKHASTHLRICIY